MANEKRRLILKNYKELAREGIEHAREETLKKEFKVGDLVGISGPPDVTDPRAWKIKEIYHDSDFALLSIENEETRVPMKLLYDPKTAYKEANNLLILNRFAEKEPNDVN